MSIQIGPVIRAILSLWLVVPHQEEGRLYMAEQIEAFTERKGIPHFFGIADAGIEEGDFDSDITIWDTGRPAPSSWIDIGPNGVTLQVDPEAKAYVRYELWDGPPPPLEPPWPQSWEGPIFLASGRIVAVGFISDEPEYYTPFDLGHEAMTWSLRISAKTPINDTEHEFPSAIYAASLFKLQFWGSRP